MQITVHRKSESDSVDEQGNPTVTTSIHVLDGFRFAPSTPAETPDRVDISGQLYGPAGADVLGTDMIEFGGELYSVDGQPEQWVSGFNSNLSGCRISVKRGA